MRKVTALLLCVVAAASVAACRDEVFEDSPIEPIRDMRRQERYNPQAYSPFFQDHRTMRDPVEGTVAREGYEENEQITTGRLEDGSGYVLEIPSEAIQRSGGMPQMQKRGQERFNIYCAPCHDKSGQGKGTVTQVPNSFPPLPKFTDARLRQLPDGQVFATISNGRGNMPGYAAQIPAQDRWAIVAYVRALQLSQLSLGEKK